MSEKTRSQRPDGPKGATLPALVPPPPELPFGAEPAYAPSPLPRDLPVLPPDPPPPTPPRPGSCALCTHFQRGGDVSPPGWGWCSREGVVAAPGQTAAKMRVIGSRQHYVATLCVEPAFGCVEFKEVRS